MTKKEYFCDMLYGIKSTSKTYYTYFLFEHKSSPEKEVFVQILKYMSLIWKAYRKKTKEGKLPVILPILIYQGYAKWQYEGSIYPLIEGSEHFKETFQTLILP